MDTAIFRALRTFVEVARRGSIKAAAAAMHVTPGAVSQQVKALEARLGHRLFERSARGLALSSKGRTLAAALDEPFASIEVALATQPQRDDRRLTISVAPAFAATWLAPRLAGFGIRHPEIEIDLRSEDRLVDLHAEHVDLAIRHGLGAYPGLVSVALASPPLIVVGASSLLRSGSQISAPADCLRYPLLQESSRSDWHLWFAAQGIHDPRARRGPSFSQDLALIRAAVAGQGLALVKEVLVEDELRGGRLVRAYAGRWPDRFAFYLVGTSAALRRPAPRAFREWVAQEIHASPYMSSG
ncbi:MAG TPA: LysR substrate-binding domain-containing protein [Alphaproteobacteria bacterium]|nr:LysR substrate-binding domain-containing protein [Alphaproteobacteria bacterium]